MKKKLIIIFSFAFLLRFLLIFTPPHVDVANHLDWGIRFWQYGARDFYEQIFWGVSWPNQPIASIFLFALIAKLNFFIFQFFWWLNLHLALFPSFLIPWFQRHLHLVLLKLPFALSDLGLGFLIYRIVRELTKKENRALLASAVFLFNPALIYNSSVWGQTDSLINFLALLSLWFLWREKFWRGFFFYLLCLYFKLSLIIFVPLILLLLWQKKDFWRRMIFSFLSTVAIFLVLSLPFVHHGNVFTWLWYLYTNRVLPRQGNMLSGNAFNLWTLFYGSDLSLKENLLIGGLTAKLWGRLIFLLSSGGVTLMMILKKKKFEFSAFLWLGIIYAFSAFLFLTNMHERYLYPIFPLLAILIFLFRKYQKFFWLFVVLSFIYLVNLYHLWWYPCWQPLVSLLTFGQHFLPRLFSLANLVLFLVILKKFWYEKRLV